MSGRKTERDIFMEFISVWDTEEKDGIVTAEEFCTYYHDVSALVESDDMFCAMIRSAWKLD